MNAGMRRATFGAIVGTAIAAILLAGVRTASRDAVVSPGARFQALVAEARVRIRELDARALARRLEGDAKTTLVDVREEPEWSAGRIPGARHISRGVLERDIEGVAADTEAEIVLYCQSGGRSALAAESLQRMGYRNVYSLRGGLKAWLDAGLALAR